MRIGFILLVAVFVISGVTSAAPSAQSQLAASLEVLTEGVEMQRAGTEQWFSVTGNGVVAEGDRIRTDEEGAALIVWFTDGTLTEIRPGTDLEITSFEGDVEDRTTPFTVTARVNRGRVIFGVARLLDAKSVFSIETPSVTAAVRGTVFALDVTEDEATLVLVTEGEVNAEREDEEVSVEGGFWLLAQPDVPLPEPVSIESVLDDPFVAEFAGQIDDFNERREEATETESSDEADTTSENSDSQ